MTLNKRERQITDRKGRSRVIHELDLPEGKTPDADFLKGTIWDEEVEHEEGIKTVTQWRAVKDARGRAIRTKSRQFMELSGPVRVIVDMDATKSRSRQGRDIIALIETKIEQNMVDTPIQQEVDLGVPNARVVNRNSV